MKKCTGENCPMQVGYDVEKCAAIEKCPYRTWPVTIADRIRSMTDNDLYCEACAMYSNNNGICNNGALPLRRPPQSWCYVEATKDAK